MFGDLVAAMSRQAISSSVWLVSVRIDCLTLFLQTKFNNIQILVITFP